MKQTFCDICGERTDMSYRARASTPTPEGQLNSEAYCTITGPNENGDKVTRNADICDECSGAIADAIQNTLITLGIKAVQAQAES